MNIYKYTLPLLLAVTFVFSLSLPLHRENNCFASEKYAGDKYEYKVVRITSIGIPEDTLNAQGEEGWEIVLIYQEQRFKYLIFKRKVVDNAAGNKINSAQSELNY
ncbi:MAG: hypothetical protein E3K37_08830 [Candidatus Kuenenia sp.]|nr:hypothetical protein [Candidatus Kuenenia hertensis]